MSHRARTRGRSGATGRMEADSSHASALLSRQPNVNLRIEELIVEGAAAGDRYALGESFETELRRLFVESGVPSSLAVPAERDRIEAAGRGVSPDTKAADVARHIARAVYDGLSGSGDADKPAAEESVHPRGRE